MWLAIPRCASALAHSHRERRRFRRQKTTGIDARTAAKLDRLTAELWQEWLGDTITQHDATRIFTSIAHQGFGFTSTLHIKDAALIASWVQTAPAILKHMGALGLGTLFDHLPYTKAPLQAATNNVDPALWATLTAITRDSPTTRHQQKTLAAIVRQQHQVNYTNQLNARDMSVYLSTGGKGAGAWLHPPTEDITPLTNVHFAIAAKLRLNRPQTARQTNTCHRSTTTSTCAQNLTPQLHHALQCPYGPYRNNRHNAIRDDLAKIINKITGTSPLKEQLLPPTARAQSSRATHPDDHDRAGRTDITWHTATETVHLDVMVTSALTQAALAGEHAASITPGCANAQAEHYKQRKYAPHNVTPIVFEAHGRFGNETLNFLRKLTNTLPEPEQTAAYHHAIQQLSTTLQHYNAKTIHAHTHSHMTPNHSHAAVTAAAAAGAASTTHHRGNNDNDNDL